MRLAQPLWLRGRGSRGRSGRGLRFDHHVEIIVDVGRSDIRRVDQVRSDQPRRRLRVKHTEPTADQVQQNEGGDDQNGPEQDLRQQIVHIAVLLGGSGSRHVLHVRPDPLGGDLQVLACVDAVAGEIVELLQLPNRVRREVRRVVPHQFSQALTRPDMMPEGEAAVVREDGTGLRRGADQAQNHHGDEGNPDALHWGIPSLGVDESRRSA